MHSKGEGEPGMWLRAQHLPRLGTTWSSILSTAGGGRKGSGLWTGGKGKWWDHKTPHFASAGEMDQASYNLRIKKEMHSQRNLERGTWPVKSKLQQSSGLVFLKSEDSFLCSHGCA